MGVKQQRQLRARKALARMRRDCGFTSVAGLEKPFNSSGEDTVNCWMPLVELWTSRIETIVQSMTGQRLEKRESDKVDGEI